MSIIKHNLPPNFHPQGHFLPLYFASLQSISSFFGQGAELNAEKCAKIFFKYVQSRLLYFKPMPSIYSLTRALLLGLTLSFAACSHHQVAQDNWPANLPDHRYFQQAYDSDATNKAIQTRAEYETWVLRFYQGSAFYRRGWIKMTDELLAELPDTQQRQDARAKMDHLGILIASEWAKKDDKRAIFTRNVAVWGNALLESIDRGQPIELINRVTNDVNKLLARKIKPDLITATRYFTPDDDSFL